MKAKWGKCPKGEMEKAVAGNHKPEMVMLLMACEARRLESFLLGSLWDTVSSLKTAQEFYLRHALPAITTKKRRIGAHA